MDFTRREETDIFIRLTNKDGYRTTIVKEKVYPYIDEIIKYINKILSERGAEYDKPIPSTETQSITYD